MPPKKAIEANVLLIDVNATQNETSSKKQDGTDFDVSMAIGDAILCRKIFSQSPDQFSIIYFGFDNQEGFFVDSDFEPPNFDMVERLDEVKPGTSSPVNVQTAIERAVKEIQRYKKDYPKSNVNGTIFLLSNLDCTPAAMLTEASARSIGQKVASAGIDLFIASPNDVVSESEGAKLKFVSGLKSHCDATWLSYSDCQKRFGIFAPKPAAPRGMPFDLMLDTGVAIKLQMYIKNKDEKIGFKFTLCEKDGTEVKKQFQHFTKPDAVLGMEDLDEITDQDLAEGKLNKVAGNQRTVDATELISGFYYGKTIVPIDDPMVREDFQVEKTGKELKLIQFTSKQNILPQYIQSSARYFLPVADTSGSQHVLMSLVKEMLKKELVAIVRYAYSASAYSRICCLIPKLTKSGVPILIHYVLPHGDDMRSYEFAILDTQGDRIDSYLEGAVEDFVDAHLLGDEDFRPKHIANPRTQHECLQLRHKALNPDDTIPSAVDTTRILKLMSKPDTKEATDAAKLLGKAFNLQINENKYPALFGNRPLGVDPLDFQEQAIKTEQDTQMKDEA